MWSLLFAALSLLRSTSWKVCPRKMMRSCYYSSTEPPLPMSKCQVLITEIHLTQTACAPVRLNTLKRQGSVCRTILLRSSFCRSGVGKCSRIENAKTEMLVSVSQLAFIYFSYCQVELVVCQCKSVCGHSCGKLHCLCLYAGCLCCMLEGSLIFTNVTTFSIIAHDLRWCTHMCVFSSIYIFKTLTRACSYK